MKNDYIMDMIEDFGDLLISLKEKITHNEEFSTVNHDEALGEAGLVGINNLAHHAKGTVAK